MKQRRWLPNYDLRRNKWKMAELIDHGCHLSFCPVACYSGSESSDAQCTWASAAWLKQILIKVVVLPWNSRNLCQEKFMSCVQKLEQKIEEALACPCVEDLREGPCGKQFVGAFSCYVRNYKADKVNNHLWTRCICVKTWMNSSTLIKSMLIKSTLIVSSRLLLLLVEALMQNTYHNIISCLYSINNVRENVSAKSVAFVFCRLCMRYRCWLNILMLYLCDISYCWSHDRQWEVECGCSLMIATPNLRLCIYAWVIMLPPFTSMVAPLNSKMVEQKKPNNDWGLPMCCKSIICYTWRSAGIHGIALRQHLKGRPASGLGIAFMIGFPLHKYATISQALPITSNIGSFYLYMLTSSILLWWLLHYARPVYDMLHCPNEVE